MGDSDRGEGECSLVSLHICQARGSPVLLPAGRGRLERTGHARLLERLEGRARTQHPRNLSRGAFAGELAEEAAGLPPLVRLPLLVPAALGRALPLELPCSFRGPSASRRPCRRHPVGHALPLELPCSFRAPSVFPALTFPSGMVISGSLGLCHLHSAHSGWVCSGSRAIIPFRAHPAAPCSEPSPLGRVISGLLGAARRNPVGHALALVLTCPSERPGRSLL